jgi:hypothetical protein
MAAIAAQYCDEYISVALKVGETIKFHAYHENLMNIMYHS